MKLLDIIKELKVNDIQTLIQIKDALEQRRDDIEAKEPYNYGSQYAKWENKLCDINDIIEDMEDLITNHSAANKELKLKQIIVDIKVHQFTYGGLKRLTL